jgi:hypothetical protein
MPAIAKTLLLKERSFLLKEGFERAAASYSGSAARQAAGPPLLGIAFGVPLRGAKTRWIIIRLGILSGYNWETSGDRQSTGSGIAVGARRFPYNAIFSNEEEESDATLTPAEKTTLTFAAGRTVTQGTVGDNVHGITVGGKLVMPSGATYVVASGENKTGTLTMDGSSVLSLGAGVLAGSDPSNNTTAATRSKLILTGDATNGAVLGGAGTAVAGGTTITGGNASGTWTAGGAAGLVTIAADSLTGNAASLALTAAGHANAEIKVGARRSPLTAWLSRSSPEPMAR